MKIVLELPLEPVNDASIGKQKIYELIGVAILEAQVETLGPPTGKIFDLSKNITRPKPQQHDRTNIIAPEPRNNSRIPCNIVNR